VDQDYLYVYALIDRRVAPPQLSGRRRLEIVDLGGVFAAVERRTETPAITEQALRDQHQIVVRLARTAKAILPVRFGTLIERDELWRVIRERQAVFEEAFEQVHGKAQMTVRVFGQAKRSPRATAPLSGTDYLRARATASRPRLPKIAREIIDAVRPLVSAEAIDAARGNVLVTINHLIERTRAPQYVSAVEPLIDTFKTSDRRVTVSGPWPPFAFAPDLLASAMPLERLTP